MPLVLDIETLPTEAALTAPYPEDRQPPANYKSPEAIAKWRETDREKWAEERVKKASLNPRLCRVLCLGWAVVTEDDGVVTDRGVFYAEHPEQEADLLRAFWRLVGTHDGNVVTWNGGWDLRVLTLRSALHDVVPSVGAYHIGLWQKKYRTAPHFDVKAVLLNWDVMQSGEGLSEWAAFFGVPGKTDGLSGKDVYPLFQGGMHDEIAEYCLADVLATAAVYGKVREYFGAPASTYEEG